MTRDRHPRSHRHPPVLLRRGRRRRTTPAVFTGGSLLFGASAAPTWSTPARTEELTRAQFHSARRLGRPARRDPGLPDPRLRQLLLLGVRHRRRLLDHRRGAQRNDALIDRRRGHVRREAHRQPDRLPGLLRPHGRPEPAGPGPVDLSPPQVGRRRAAAQAHRRRRVGRRPAHPTAYAAEHLAGSIGIELGGQFSTYLGWLIPWGTPLTLLGESAEQVAEAQRQLVRIGIDRPDAPPIGSPPGPGRRATRRGSPAYDVGLLRRPRRLTDAERAVAHRPRHPPRRRAGRRPRSPARSTSRCTRCSSGSTRSPTGPLWVHCASGFRASIAASLLARAGHDVTLIDDDYATHGRARPDLEPIASTAPVTHRRT